MMPSVVLPVPEFWNRILTSLSGCSYGSGFRTAASTIEKMAVLAPIPRANVAIAAAENAGARLNMRTA